jgi:hypothetical protein
MVMAAEYPFFEILGSMVLFFAWLSWVWMAITVLSDVFRRHDISGGTKAGWILAVIVLPFLGVLIYVISNGEQMARRRAEESQAARAGFDDYVKTVAASGGAAAEIERGKQLLDSGAITRDEFATIKATALAQQPAVGAAAP